MTERTAVYAEYRAHRTAEDSEADALLEREISSKLAQSPYVALRRIRCDAQDGAVFLSGSVSSFYLKQLATAAGRQVEGVETIRNELKVESDCRQRA
jgi:osmotically-inducible protein OsmY